MRRHLPLAITLCSLLSAAALAQTPAPPRLPAGTPAASPTGGGTGAAGKVAVLVTAAFPDQILELKVKFDALKSEFDPKEKELQGLNEQLEGLKKQIEKQGNTVSPAVRSQWNEQGADLEKKIKRSQEDGAALYEKRFNDVVGPIQEKIAKFMDQYAQQRGITMIIEGVAAQKNGLLLWAADATNVTDDFIKEYNKANPVVAATSGATKK
jgi:outer membrane protein